MAGPRRVVGWGDGTQHLSWSGPNWLPLLGTLRSVREQTGPSSEAMAMQGAVETLGMGNKPVISNGGHQQEG